MLELSKIETSLTTSWLGRGGNELLDMVDSTNSRAMELARNGGKHGTMIIAIEQTGGRGRNGHDWFSPAASGLYISFLIRSKTQLANLPVITLVTGVAIAQAIQKSLNIRPGLKWVNDLILDGKKIGGILCEYCGSIGSAAVPAQKRGNNEETVGARFTEPASKRGNPEERRGGLHPPAALIVGIGLNIRPPKTDPPPDLNEKISFLQSYLSSGEPSIDPNHLIATITNELEAALDKMQSGNLSSLLNQWRAYSITLGEEIIAQIGEKQITGQALDITDTGELIIKTHSGNVTLSAGEVSIRGTTGSYI